MNGNYFYVGNPAPSYKSGHNPNCIPASAHKSSIFLPPSVTSWPRDLSMPAEPYILHTPKGEMAIMKTANNIFATPIEDYHRHGYFSQVDDFNMKGWLDAGTKASPNMFDEVALPEKSWHSRVLVSMGEKQAKFMHGDTYLRKYVHDIQVNEWPNNEVGKAFSRIENLRQALMKYYRTEEAQDFIDYLRAEGFEPEEIGYLGARTHPKEARYAVARTSDGRVVFFTFEDAYKGIVREARAAGITPEQYIRDAFHEEHAHIYRRSFDNIRNLGELLDEEIETKSMVRDFYILKAEELKGKSEGKHYRKMAAIMQHDIDTTRERYTEIHMPKQGLDSLIKEIEAEARRIGADPTEYVSAYLAKHNLYSREGKEYEAGSTKREYNKKETQSRAKGREKGKETREMTKAEAARANEAEEGSREGEKSDSSEGNSESAEGGEASK